jgi:PIN domain nuclease of toxin-antitoxin system
LDLGQDIHAWFDMARKQPGVVIAPLAPEEAIGASLLPGLFHRDPADRLIVAYARRIDAELATVDKRILAYPHVRTIS